MVDVRKETTFFYLQAFDATRPNQALLWYSSDAQCIALRGPLVMLDRRKKVVSWLPRVQKREMGKL